MCHHYQAEKRRQLLEKRFGVVLPADWEPPPGGLHIYPTDAAPILRRPIERFYDLVVQVAIVRPGPIQGGMVHPYLRRRTGEEPVDYPSEDIKTATERTLGVPLFQEQVMQIAMLAADFTAGEADQLRRAMGAWRKRGGLEVHQERLIRRMRDKGYTADFAERIAKQVEGFGSYGFPESHAASFGLLVYVSCWLKRHHPDDLLAGLLNSQPMGFYAPAQLVRDAREHGVWWCGRSTSR